MKIKTLKIPPASSTSSGNVFLDLGFQNPEECLAKAQFASEISDLIKKKKLSKKAAAKLLGITQEKLADLLRGALSKFQLGKLFNFLVLLGQEITFNLSPIMEVRKTKRMVVQKTKVKRKVIPAAPITKSPNRPAMIARKKK